MNLTTHQRGRSNTGAIVCIRTVHFIDTYVSSWVALACTVTTTKHLIDDIGAVDGDISSGHGSGITTAIDILDTGLIATVNEHLGKGLGLFIIVIAQSLCRNIIGLVAATVDSSYVIAVGRSRSNINWLLTIHRPLHPYLHMPLRCTVVVVTSEDLSSVVGFIVDQLCTIQSNGDITTYDRFNTGIIAFLAIGSCCFLSQTAAKDITIDRTSEQVHFCL